jgi:hypothetical protein
MNFTSLYLLRRVMRFVGICAQSSAYRGNLTKKMIHGKLKIYSQKEFYLYLARSNFLVYFWNRNFQSMIAKFGWFFINTYLNKTKDRNRQS